MTVLLIVIGLLAGGMSAALWSSGFHVLAYLVLGVCAIFDVVAPVAAHCRRRK